MADLDIMRLEYQQRYGNLETSTLFTCAMMDDLIDYKTYEAAEFYFAGSWDERG